MTKKSLKILVIAFLADLPKSKTEQFNKAFELYRKSPNKNLGIERRLNMAGFTEDGLQGILYDLKQLHGISDVEIKSYRPKQESQTEDTITCVFQLLRKMSKEERKQWAKIDCVGKGIGLEEVIQEAEENEEAVELIDDLKEAKEEIELENVEADNGQEETKSIREEYPFLNDADCPAELLIVVGKKIAAWKRYQTLHNQIQNFDVEKDGEEKLSELTAEATKEYEDNQALDAELKHYAETETVLGKHDCLIEFKLNKEVDRMNNDQLHKFVNSSAKFFTDQKKRLEKSKEDAVKVAELKEKTRRRELKLQLVKNKLGLS